MGGLNARIPWQALGRSALGGAGSMATKGDQEEIDSQGPAKLLGRILSLVARGPENEDPHGTLFVHIAFSAVLVLPFHPIRLKAMVFEGVSGFIVFMEPALLG